MKKLYIFAGMYVTERNIHKEEPERTETAQKELKELNDFLWFVWQHRND